MNDGSSGPFIVGLLFILRCLIPVGILFGVSYLLRRLELVIEHTDEEGKGQGAERQEQTLTATRDLKQASLSNSRSGPKQQMGKKKPIAPQKRSRNQ